MAVRKSVVYATYLIITGAVVTAFTFNFLILNLGSAGQGSFIMPGGFTMEWLLAILSILGTTVGAGFIIMVLGTATFVLALFKIHARKDAVSLVEIEDLPVKALSRQIFNRTVVLGLFAFNLAYTAASQGFIVEFWRSVNPPTTLTIPDPEVMLQLVWLTVVPSIAVIVPIWCVTDAGVIVKKKQEGLAVMVTELAGSNLYRFVKGFIGGSFVLNLGILIGTWVWPALFSGGSLGWFTLVLQIGSPVFIVFMLFPLPIIIAAMRLRIRALVVKLAARHNFGRTLPG